VAQFQPGDVVQLKSGGPPMTVCSISKEDGQVWCNWFVQDDKKQTHFHPEVLVKVDETASQPAASGGRRS